MTQGRTHLRHLFAIVAIIVLASLTVAWWNADRYDSAKGVSGAPEFVGKPPSFALTRLGQPIRTYEYTLGEALNQPLRGNLLNLEPPVPSESRVREVTWERRQNVPDRLV